jgi:nitrite reductase/ring-hydroxylating ferredoxin subunit
MTESLPTSGATLDAGALGRRRFVGCALAFGVTGPLLVACSSGADDAGSGGGTGGSGGESPTPTSGSSLVAVTDVPVGGGVALTDVQIVVTQPAKGQFKAFSAICTHQGGTINRVEGGDMICPLHGSRFSIKDGSVDNGPASNPLKEIPVAVKGGQVIRA